MYSAIVPAAGRSARMEHLKPLLPFGDRTVIERVVSIVLDSCVDRIVVVLGHRADEIRPVLERYPVDITLNPDPEGDMLSSIQCGVRVAPEDAAMVVVPGDQPLISKTLIDRLISMFEESDAGIVLPSFEGKRGHPILFHARYRESILALEGTGGLKQLRDRYPDDMLVIPVDTDEVLIDIDYYHEYEQALKRLSEDG